MHVICDRVSSDYLNVDTSNPVEVYLTMAWSREQPEVLLTDRAKVKALRDSLSEWLGEPKRRLEIEGSPSDGYDAWFTDSDGNLHTVVSFAHPMAAADWCERNGFAWEVIGLEGDPAQWLADWRAQQ